LNDIKEIKISIIIGFLNSAGFNGPFFSDEFFWVPFLHFFIGESLEINKSKSGPDPENWDVKIFFHIIQNFLIEKIFKLFKY